MSHYRNFTTVIYCTAPWAARVSEADLVAQIEFLKKYTDFDKVYLEPFRGELASREQLAMCKRVFTDHGITVSGGITTVTPDLQDEDEKRQRLFHTFCYSNEKMREHLRNMVIYTAEHFDEFIIDDFFFTQCTCEDCQKEKGSRSWSEFRLEKMREVSENLVIKPAKQVNPNINIIIKYPNWKESFQETGYNPAVQKDMFEMIYTGTETRHPVQTDQHLPRYLSYSLMRFMENTAPNRNGGGWFDPYECYTIDTYLEQGYLTAFSKPKEIMLFCWHSLYKNKVITPLGFRLKQIDAILDSLGKPIGIPVYLPHNAQGEDHLEDYLGMLGIPFEPMPDFPAYSDSVKQVFLTVQALYDKEIIAKVRAFLNQGGKVIASSGFILGALQAHTGIEELTSIRYRGRRVAVDEFHISRLGHNRMCYDSSYQKIGFPLLEHRNNATWSLINAGNGDHHCSILMRDTYGKGELITLVVPDLFSELKKLPQAALTRIRQEFSLGKVYLDAPAQISLFTYSNDTFGIYSYTASGCAPEWIQIHVVGVVKELMPLPSGEKVLPLYIKENETVFEIRSEPGDFAFYQIS
jgi:hypothetical protein